MEREQKTSSRTPRCTAGGGWGEARDGTSENTNTKVVAQKGT